MPLFGAEFDRVNTQHTFAVLWQVRLARSVAVVGHDDKVEPGARRGAGDRVDVAGTIRSPAVHVNRTAHRRCGRTGDREQRSGARRQRRVPGAHRAGKQGDDNHALQQSVPSL